MKRWALPVSLAVALSATTATAFAESAPLATNFRGHFKSAIQYNSSDVNKKVIGSTNPGDEVYHLPEGAFGVVDVDLRGDIVLSPNADNRFVLELRQRIRGDKLLDQFPTRVYSAFGSSSNTAAFARDLTGSRFQPETGKLVDKAYFENKSSWWAGGPTVTTRIGRVDPNINPWVAKFSRFDRNGATVQGLQVGPLTFDVGYIWGGDGSLRRTRVLPGADAGRTVDGTSLAEAVNNNTMAPVEGIQSLFLGTKVGLDVLDLDLAAVRTTWSGDDKAVFDYAVGLSAPLGDAANLTGAYAHDDLNDKNAYNVKVSTQWGAADIWGRYRKVEEGFSPIYEDRDDFMNPEKRTEAKVHDERTGFEVGASGEVYNWKLSASYDSSYREWLGFKDNEKVSTVKLGAATTFQAGNSPIDFAIGATIENSDEQHAKYVQEAERSVIAHDPTAYGLTLYRVGPKSDKTTITASLGTNFDILRASYELKLTDEKGKEKMTDHTLGLSAPIKMAYLDTIHVGANLQLRNGRTKGDAKEREDTGYGVDLAWQGANGLRVGVHYTDGYNGKYSIRQQRYDSSDLTKRTDLVTADTDFLRKYTYPDGTSLYLGNGLAVTAGWGISF